MDTRDPESDEAYEIFFHTAEEQIRQVEAALRRWRSREGSPVLTMDQLAAFKPRHAEARFVQTTYDRFSARLKSPQRPSASP